MGFSTNQEYGGILGGRHKPTLRQRARVLFIRRIPIWKRVYYFLFKRGLTPSKPIIVHDAELAERMTQLLNVVLPLVSRSAGGTKL
jgi:hypothetical protein